METKQLNYQIKATGTAWKLCEKSYETVMMIGHSLVKTTC